MPWGRISSLLSAPSRFKARRWDDPPTWRGRGREARLDMATPPSPPRAGARGQPSGGVCNRRPAPRCAIISNEVQHRAPPHCTLHVRLFAHYRPRVRSLEAFGRRHRVALGFSWSAPAARPTGSTARTRRARRCGGRRRRTGAGSGGGERRRQEQDHAEGRRHVLSSLGRPTTTR